MVRAGTGSGFAWQVQLESRPAYIRRGYPALRFQLHITKPTAINYDICGQVVAVTPGFKIYTDKLDGFYEFCPAAFLHC